MPSPISPRTLEDLVPTRNGSFCGRFIPGIINWMQARADYYRWMYKDNGDLTVSFITDLCVVKNGTTPTDPSTCPPVVFSSKIVPRDGVLRLTLTGTGMTAGYAWSLYRSTTQGVFAGSAITSGTTTSSVITYNDSGLTNETTYYYKLTVQKPGCAAISFQTSGVPKLCIPFDFQVTVTSGDVGVITVQAANVDPDNPIDGTFAYQIYNGLLLIDSGLISDHSCTLNGSIGLCRTLGGVTGSNVIINVIITEKVGCQGLTRFQPVVVMGQEISIPRISVGGGTIFINHGGGNVLPNHYVLYRSAAGNCNSGGQGQAIVPPNAGVNAIVAMTRAQWPCTENGPVPNKCLQKYLLWAIAVAADGSMSGSSEVFLTDYGTVPLLPGRCGT